MLSIFNCYKKIHKEQIKTEDYKIIDLRGKKFFTQDNHYNKNDLNKKLDYFNYKK